MKVVMHMKHIIFDLDGTLLDSAAVWEHLGIEFLTQRKIQPKITPEQMDYELEIRNLNEGAIYLKEEYTLSDSCEEIISAMLELVKDRYLACDVKDPIYEKAILHQLKLDGYHLYVLTSSFETIAKQCLQNHHLLSLFDAVETISPGSSKADGSAYQLFMQKHQLAKEDVLVVEDALHAIRGVKSLGVKVIAIEELYFEMNLQSKDIADGYVKDYQALYKIIKESESRN